MIIDNYLNESFDSLKKMKWNDFIVPNEKYDYYYAENRLYVIRDKVNNSISLIKANSPADALNRLIEEETAVWLDAEICHGETITPVQVCSKCNTFFPLAYTGGGHKFCPACGRRMVIKHE